jgi:hypothetical protein
MLTWHANKVRYIEQRIKLNCMKNVEDYNGYFKSLGVKLTRLKIQGHSNSPDSFSFAFIF